MPRWSRRGSDAGPDAGSASLEFIGAGVILLVPLVYLILAMAALQGGSLAVEGAARHAARVYVQAPSEAEADARVSRAVAFAFDDYSVPTDASAIQIDCDGPGSCLARQRRVTVTVRTVVPLPLIPDFLAGSGPAGIPIEASATQTVSRFWGATP